MQIAVLLAGIDPRYAPEVVCIRNVTHDLTGLKQQVAPAAHPQPLRLVANGLGRPDLGFDGGDELQVTHQAHLQDQ